MKRIIDYFKSNSKRYQNSLLILTQILSLSFLVYRMAENQYKVKYYKVSETEFKPCVHSPDKSGFVCLDGSSYTLGKDHTEIALLKKWDGTTKTQILDN